MQIYDYRSSQFIAVNDQAYNVYYTLYKAAYYNDHFIISAVPDNNDISCDRIIGGNMK